MTDDARLDLLDQVRDLLRQDASVVGVVLIGSGAVGFRDEFSDVDLMAVVDAKVDATAFGDQAASLLRETLPVDWYMREKPAPAVDLHVFLLANHLELDLSFVSVNDLGPIGPRWRVVFDPTGEVAQRMAGERPPPPPLHERARLRYEAGCASLWRGLKALRRGELLHAAYRLHNLRGHLTALAALDCFGTDRDAETQADSLPETQKERLRRLTTKVTEADLRASFREAIDLLQGYDETLLRERLGDDEYAGLATWVTHKHATYLGAPQRRPD